jgi:hypothetical protein
MPDRIAGKTARRIKAAEVVLDLLGYVAACCGKVH